jgi:hypothetical protein
MIFGERGNVIAKHLAQLHSRTIDIPGGLTTVTNTVPVSLASGAKVGSYK